MQTTRAYDQERSVWSVLPVHPQPKFLEALSGYMLRLAEANGLKSINELAHLSGFHFGWGCGGAYPDYTSFLTGRLAEIAGYSPDYLQNMTFSHLARHFACPPLPFWRMRAFFQGCIAPSLRYCPACLAEQPYYRLCWRFLALAGCSKHQCSLLSECGYCGRSIPLLPLYPRVACCTMCQGDLRMCSMTPLPQQTGVHLERRTHDLELLLMPAEWAPEITSALLQGSGFIFLRQRKHLSLTEATRLMGRDEQIIAEIEGGSWGKNATLADYWQYTEILGSSLSDVLEAAQLMRSSEDESRRSSPDEQDLRRSHRMRSHHRHR